MWSQALIVEFKFNNCNDELNCFLNLVYIFDSNKDMSSLQWDFWSADVVVFIVDLTSLSIVRCGLRCHRQGRRGARVLVSTVSCPTQNTGPPRRPISTAVTCKGGLSFPHAHRLTSPYRIFFFQYNNFVLKNESVDQFFKYLFFLTSVVF